MGPEGGMEMVRELEHLCYKESLKEPHLLNLERVPRRPYRKLPVFEGSL